MILPDTLLGTTTIAVLSLASAAFITRGLARRLDDRVVCFCIGLLLATATCHFLPEALESEASTYGLGAAALAGFAALFAIGRLRDRIPSGLSAQSDDAIPRPAQFLSRTGMFVLFGSGVHNFSDGLVVAASFLVDRSIGATTVLVVLLHEIPHKFGDIVVLQKAGIARPAAVALAALAGAAIVAGGAAGAAFIAETGRYLPYLLAVAAGTFVYIALFGLWPHVVRQPSLPMQHWSVRVAFLVAGAVLAASL